MKNVEFKVRVKEISSYEKKLLNLNPVYTGTDQQTDTYFNVKKGRLKLREGNIENALIHYHRADIANAKQSDIILYKCSPDPALKQILTLHLGLKVVVEKIRKIYFIENAKFHFDEVKGLGFFVEVEAIDRKDKYSVEMLKSLCDKYFEFFGFEKNMLLKNSYSDMLL
jgi:predicted adenylyl cyclase CyaB